MFDAGNVLFAIAVGVVVVRVALILFGVDGVVFVGLVDVVTIGGAAVVLLMILEFFDSIVLFLIFVVAINGFVAFILNWVEGG